MFAQVQAEDSARHQEPHQVIDDHDQHQQPQHHANDGSGDHASLDGHFLKDQQANAGGTAHDVGRVLGVAGEGAVVGEVHTLDEDGAVPSGRVPHELQSVSERALVVQVGLSVGVVEDRDGVPRAVGPVHPGEGDVVRGPVPGEEGAGQPHVGAH